MLTTKTQINQSIDPSMNPSINQSINQSAHYLSSNFIVVKVHPISDIGRFLRSGGFRRVHELSTKFNSIFNIVTAPSPLPALHCVLALTCTHVARARC